MSRYAGLLIARVGSSRLPNKHLQVVQGKTLLEHLIDRVRLARRVDRIVLCTTTQAADRTLVELAEQAGIAAFQGSELNVLQRFLDAAQQHAVDFSVIVEGDEVFCDWALIDAVIERYEQSHADYVTLRGVPIGSYLHGIRTAALQQICDQLDASASTHESWDQYLKGPKIRVSEITASDTTLNTSDARLTLDWPDDLKLIQAIYDRLYTPGHPIPLRDVVALLRREPSLMAINQHLVKAYAERQNARRQA